MTQKQKKIWIELGKVLFATLILVFLLRVFVFSTSIIEGKSMYPTLNSGERIVYNKIAYMNAEPNRGDIVIIKRPIRNYVKRIIGLPNETIEIRDQQLLINNTIYHQSFITTSQTFNTPDFGPVTIPEDSYFVMGDNRQLSIDSRNGLGVIARDEIIGRSEFVIFPFSEWQSLE
ncbi:signal peptidase I T [Paraliobacillus quinghaiensis]|uniref:Signal peptidase I n=1 Tax=Paraliobacillus quinghaiensis TaxID=470815 RepID=A0A917TER1_9BACI|nr:signal peptidase I [Paraliobacillus quinghaiensis]GGM20080.1 signal peptidase I T [Paraliobacillus quinghaiensis]